MCGSFAGGMFFSIGVACLGALGAGMCTVWSIGGFPTGARTTFSQADVPFLIDPRCSLFLVSLDLLSSLTWASNTVTLFECEFKELFDLTAASNISSLLHSFVEIFPYDSCLR